MIAVENVLRVEGLKSFLDRRCGSKTILFAMRLGQQIGRTSLAERLQDCPLFGRELFPESLEVLCLPPHELDQHGVHIRRI